MLVGPGRPRGGPSGPPDARLLDFGLATAARARRDREPLDTADDDAAPDGAGHDRRHLSVHGARAARRAKGRRAHRHLRVWRRALRDADWQEGVRREQPRDPDRGDSQGRSATGLDASAADAARARSRRQEMPGEAGGRSLAGGERCDAGTEVGGGSRVPGERGGAGARSPCGSPQKRTPAVDGSGHGRRDCDRGRVVGHPRDCASASGDALRDQRAADRQPCIARVIARRPPARLRCDDGWGVEVVGACARCHDGASVCRHRRRELPVLGSEWPCDRVLRRRQAEARRSPPVVCRRCSPTRLRDGAGRGIRTT